MAGIALSPYLYLLVGCSAAAMLLYQAALQASRASILIPVSNVVSGLYFVIAGTWLFHELLPASPAKLALRPAGIAAAGLVLVVLSRQAAPAPPASGAEPRQVPRPRSRPMSSGTRQSRPPKLTHSAPQGDGNEGKAAPGSPASSSRTAHPDAVPPSLTARDAAAEAFAADPGRIATAVSYYGE